MKVAGIIPARYGSTRFPGKPLALIQGKPMIQWVYENALQCEAISELWVATDHEDIRQTVLNFGGKVIMTLEEHPSGTDRCLEAYIKSESDADVVINIQGDEPFIKPEMLQSVAHQFEKSHVDIATLGFHWPRPVRLVPGSRGKPGPEIQNRPGCRLRGWSYDLGRS